MLFFCSSSYYKWHLTKKKKYWKPCQKYGYFAVFLIFDTIWMRDSPFNFIQTGSWHTSGTWTLRKKLIHTSSFLNYLLLSPDLFLYDSHFSCYSTILSISLFPILLLQGKFDLIKKAWMWYCRIGLGDQQRSRHSFEFYSHSLISNLMQNGHVSTLFSSPSSLS